MNIFVIHSGSDRDAAQQIATSLKQASYSLNTLVLKNGNCFWKLEAAGKIKKAQLVLFVVGENSHASPNIAWELREAIKHKKPVYFLKLDPGYALHDALFIKDPFTGEKGNIGREITEAALVEIVKSYDAGDYGLFNAPLEQLDQRALLEQYKLFLQTSEDLVKRRQSVNSFYISISSALVTVMGVFFAMDFGAHTEFVVGVLFCFIGMILSVSWSRTLTSYGNLNASKMKIISSIEKQLPLSLYDAEWAALSDKLNKKKYVSFTESEQIIPRLFGAVYLLAAVLMAAAHFA